MGSTASYINRTFAVLRSFPSNPFADACFSIKLHKNLRSENVLLLLHRRLMDDGWRNLTASFDCIRMTAVLPMSTYYSIFSLHSYLP